MFVQGENWDTKSDHQRACNTSRLVFKLWSKMQEGIHQSAPSKVMEQEESDSKNCVVMPSASWVIRQAGRYTILGNTQPEKFFFFLFLARSSSDIYDERLRKRSKRRLVWPKRWCHSSGIRALERESERYSVYSGSTINWRCGNLCQCERKKALLNELCSQTEWALAANLGKQPEPV